MLRRVKVNKLEIEHKKNEFMQIVVFGLTTGWKFIGGVNLIVLNLVSSSVCECSFSLFSFFSIHRVKTSRQFFLHIPFALVFIVLKKY